MVYSKIMEAIPPSDCPITSKNLSRKRPLPSSSIRFKDLIDFQSYSGFKDKNKVLETNLSDAIYCFYSPPKKIRWGCAPDPHSCFLWYPNTSQNNLVLFYSKG
jgi:hypothetical protein